MLPHVSHSLLTRASSCIVENDLDRLPVGRDDLGSLAVERRVLQEVRARQHPTFGLSSCMDQRLQGKDGESRRLKVIPPVFEPRSHFGERELVIFERVVEVSVDFPASEESLDDTIRRDALAPQRLDAQQARLVRKPFQTSILEGRPGYHDGFGSGIEPVIEEDSP